MSENSTKIKDSKLTYTHYGYISYRYREIFFKVAKLTYELFENESFQYIYEPYYDVINAFEHFDIPGLDLSIKESVYYRTNMTPVFISERVTPKNRVNLIEELKTYNMDYYQPFLLLLDSKNVYGGDKLSLKSHDFYLDLMDQTKDTKDVYKNIIYTLRRLGARIDFNIGEIQVNFDNRTLLIQNYLHLYDMVAMYYENKSKNSRGRKKKSVSWIVLREIQKQYKNGLITMDEAVEKSGLGSRRTYYRRIKEFSENELK